MHINLEDFHIVYTMYLYVTIEMVCNNYNLYNFTMKRKIEITKHTDIQQSLWISSHQQNYYIV